MNVLVLGSGGREHVLSWKIAQSTKLKKLFIAPGNAGTSLTGENVRLDPGNFDEIANFCLKNNINILVVGPEAPLVDGISDFFRNSAKLKHIGVIGPVKEAAMLEGSKDFAKKFMTKYNIPTARHRTFCKDQLNEAMEYLETINAPYVLKADGLAAGKGVVICNSIDEAKKELFQMLAEQKFGKASEKVLVEEFLQGIELSVFALTDGRNYKVLPVAKDYKRIGKGDTGLNTGGMGSISPVDFADDKFMKKVDDRIIKPTINGLLNEDLTYKGFIFFGLINCNGDPYVIEYNVRMGDPEAQSVVPRIKSDLLELFEGVTSNKLDNMILETDPRYTASVILVSGGYPEKYEKNKLIKGLSDINSSMVFFAGAEYNDDNKIISTGGRVLAITSYGNSLKEALSKSYKNTKLIHFDKMYFRDDLGFDLI